MRKQVLNSGAAMFEGVGAAYHPTHEPVVEECGSNPFGSNVKNEVEEALRMWLNASAETRYTPGALHTLRERLTRHSEADVQKVIQETSVRSDLPEITRGLRAAGLLKSSKKAAKKSVLTENQSPSETAERLLREAVVFLPPSEEPLRRQIESYLGQR